MKTFSRLPLSRKYLWIYVLLLFALVGTQALFAAGQIKRSRKQIVKKTALVKKSANRRNRRNKTKLIPAPRAADEFEADPEKRREWFMFQRTFPSGDLP